MKHKNITRDCKYVYVCLFFVPTPPLHPTPPPPCLFVLPKREMKRREKKLAREE